MKNQKLAKDDAASLFQNLKIGICVLICLASQISLAVDNKCLQPGTNKLNDQTQKKLTALGRSAGCSMFGYTPSCMEIAGIATGAAAVGAAGVRAAHRMRSPKFNVCNFSAELILKDNKKHILEFFIPSAIAAPACALDVAIKMKKEALDEAIEVGLSDIKKGNAEMTKELDELKHKFPEADRKKELDRITAEREKFAKQAEEIQESLAAEKKLLADAHTANSKEVEALRAQLSQKWEQFEKLDRARAYATGAEYERLSKQLEIVDSEFAQLSQQRKVLIASDQTLKQTYVSKIKDSNTSLREARAASDRADALIRKAASADQSVLARVSQLETALASNSRREQLLISNRKFLSEPSLSATAPVRQLKIFESLLKDVSPTSLEMRNRLTAFELINNTLNADVAEQVARAGERGFMREVMYDAWSGFRHGGSLKSRVVMATAATAVSISPAFAAASENTVVQGAGKVVEFGLDVTDPIWLTEQAATAGWYATNGSCTDRVRSPMLDYKDKLSCSDIKLEFNDRNINFVFASDAEQAKAMTSAEGPELCSFVNQMYDKIYSGWSGECKKDGSIHAWNNNLSAGFQSIGAYEPKIYNPPNPERSRQDYELYMRKFKSSLGTDSSNQVALHILEVQQCCSGNGMLSDSECKAYNLRGMPAGPKFSGTGEGNLGTGQKGAN